MVVSTASPSPSCCTGQQGSNVLLKKTTVCAMEVKVSVDGIQRVVCGVTEETTCQEVVIALAQALGMCGVVVVNTEVLTWC